MKAIAGIVAALCLLLHTNANAQGWPNKPVHVIVPYAAGGANDLLGRVFAEKLSKLLEIGRAHV